MFIELLQKSKNPNNTLVRLYTILCSFNRRAELMRLIQWARRKKLSGPLQAYQNRLIDEEKRLFHYALEFPSLLRWAKYLHRLNNLVNPIPRYVPKGSAAIYSRKFLTNSRKTYSMNYVRV